LRVAITLGLLIDQLVSGYARRIIAGVSNGSRSQDANLIVFSGRVLGTPHGYDYQNNVIFDCITPGTIDALVMATGTQGSFLPFEHLLSSLGRLKGMPLVSIGIRIEGVPSILTDNRTGILEAMDHLVDVHGLRRIAFLKGPEMHHEAQERFAAYRDSVRARGLDEDPGLWLQADFTRAGARRALAQHIQRHGGPDFQALVAANDEMAIGALEALRERGWVVPRDLSIVGFDNIDDSQFVVPSLTTVGQLLLEQGQAAATCAAALARGEAAPLTPVLSARLVLRTSCGCLPRSVAAFDSMPTRPRRRRSSAIDAGKIVEQCLARFAASQPEKPRDAIRRQLHALVEEAGTDAFLHTLQGALSEEVAAGVDITGWQSLLTVLQGELLSAARTSEAGALLQRCFQKALALLSEMLRIEQGKAMSDLQGHMANLRRATERLASEASMEELMDELADELGLLDMRTCFVACYPEVQRHLRGEGWVVPDRAVAALAWVDGERILPAGDEKVFSPAERFVPEHFLPRKRRYMLVATATFFREDQIGYIAFEPGQRDFAIYESFCVQLSSLLNSSLLFSARQRVVEALERERALIAVLMDTIPEHIYFKDGDSRFMLVNRSLANALGLGDPAEAAGRTDFDFFTPEHAGPARDAERSIMRSGEPLVDFEEKETWPDGRVTWVSTTKMPLRDAKGDIIGTFGLSKDITERRQSEERILRLATLVESSRDAIFGVDMRDLVTSWNKGAEEMYGYGADEMVGRPVSDLMTAAARTAAKPFWENVRMGQEVQHFETTGRKKSGASVSISFALSPIREQSGKIVGIAVIAREMTEEKAIQARLIQALRLESLGTLAGGIAHQFNNINTIIKGNLDALMDSSGSSAAARSFGREALKGVDRLVDITERLQGLTVSSEPGGETCCLNQLARSLLHLFEKRFEEMGVAVVLELQETPPVLIHRSRAGFVLTSLLGNSLDAMLDRSVRTLTIRTGNGPQSAFLEVRDTGCGIPREDIPRLFTPFFTMKGEWAPSDSSQAKVKGVGLSLAVCRSTVSESGGRIEVDSEPGVGATFRVWLPTVP
jgi:PAS domain S-box-containing protein